MGRSLNAAPGSKILLPNDLRSYDGPLLLDTHIWIWHLEGGSSQLSGPVTSLIERSGTASRLLVSDISYWEVAVKAAKGKLTLSVDVSVWLSRAATAPGIRFLPIDRDVLLLSTRLAGTAHNDPADRMLLATAQLNHVPLVTADKLLIDYAKANPGTPVVDARR